MVIKHTNYQIAWIDRSNNPSIDISNKNEDCSWHHLPLKSNLGTVLMKTMRLGMGMTIFHWKFEFSPEARSKRIPFIQLTSAYPERSLSVRSVMGGAIGFNDADLDYELTVGPDVDLFRLESMIDTEFYLNGSSNCQLINLRISEAQLNNLLGKTASHDLLEKLQLGSLPHATLNRTPHVTRALLHATFSEKYLGQAKTFYIQAVVLEYFASLITSLGTHLGAEFEPKFSTMMTRLHEQLSYLTGHIPSLIELGEQYQTPPRILNHQFIQQFNQSIHSFITQQRLNQAHYTITNTKKALKTIAAELSYSHVNHFSAAFKNYFGCSPSQLRTQKRDK